MPSFKWPSTPPSDCPFQPSTALTGIVFTGRHAEYTGADTWYPSWASDDNLYSPWTDGNIDWPIEQGWDVTNFQCSSDGRNPVNKGTGLSGTGQAKIVGSDPLNLRVENLGVHYSPTAPYGGRYPSATLVHNGIWYYGTYCLDETNRKTEDGRNLNWDILGPFVGFRVSTDYGKTWVETPHTPANPIFGESGKDGKKVKIGAPHAVDFGKNMQHSPDGKAYFVGHGATRPDANLAWIAGDQAYLIRVVPSPENINDPSRYEFFGGHDSRGEPIWTGDFARIKPLIEWNNRVGCVTMTYNAPLGKYLMCVVDGWPTVNPMNTYLLESDRITGPWKLVTFMERFGIQAYFVNIPSKFIGADGRTAWLCYAANFTNAAFGTKWEANPPGSKYAMCLHEFRLETPA
jgi:hypothetical protein